MTQPHDKREHLRRLIEEKRAFDAPLAPLEKELGFRGWHERGYLPHCDKPGLVQLVTFRLHDSMPVSRRGEWEHLLRLEDESQKRIALEVYLDRGEGGCFLRQHPVAALVETAMLHHHGERFQMLAWVVMPNHVHALIHVRHTPLSKVLQNWKSLAAVEANKLLRRSGRFWQPDYWDTFMRDEEQTRRAVRYIENNPVKARLCRTPEEWPFNSARFRDPKTRELILPKQ